MANKAPRTPEIELLLFFQDLYKFDMNLISNDHEYVLIVKDGDVYRVWFPREQGQYYLEDAVLDLSNVPLLSNFIDNSPNGVVKITRDDIDNFRKTVQSRVDGSVIENGKLEISYRYTIDDPNAAIEPEVEEKADSLDDIEKEKPTRVRKPKIEMTSVFPICEVNEKPTFYQANDISSIMLPNEKVDEKDVIIRAFLDENNTIRFDDGRFKLLTSSNNNLTGVIKTFGKKPGRGLDAEPYDKYILSYCKEKNSRDIVRITSKGSWITFNQYFATVISRKGH